MFPSLSSHNLNSPEIIGISSPILANIPEKNQERDVGFQSFNMRGMLILRVFKQYYLVLYHKLH